MIRVKLLTALLIISNIITLTACSNMLYEKYEVSENKYVPITLSWWGTDDRNKYTMDGVDIFSEKNPDISVDYRYGEFSGFERKNRVWMESGNAPDVMQINYSWIDTYSPDGDGYYDLNSLEEYIDYTNYDSDDLIYGMKNGKLNALPIALNTATVFHNEDLYKEYNLEPPKTWDDIFEVASIVKEDDRYVFGVSKKQFFLILIAYYEQTTGQRAFSEDGHIEIDKKGYGILLEFYKKLINSNAMMSVGDFNRSKFANGTCLSSVLWLSDADNYGNGLKDNGYNPIVGSFFTREDAKLSGMYIKPATLYAINKKTNSPAEAARLLNFLVNDEDMIILQATEKGVPINKKAIKILEENNLLDNACYAAFNEMQKNKDKMDIMISAMENEDTIDEFRNIAAEYVYDQVPVNVVIDKLYKNLN